jgi:hypothetical protein
MPRLLLPVFICAAAAVFIPTGEAAEYAPLLREDIYSPSCYRYGRCDTDDPRDERLRQQRLERLAPRAPDNPPHREMIRRNVSPTPVEEVREPYRAAGEVREEFQRSGTALQP